MYDAISQVSELEEKAYVELKVESTVPYFLVGSYNSDRFFFKVFYLTSFGAFFRFKLIP